MEWVFRILALQPGLEPGTCGLTVRRSTDWAIGESDAHFREERKMGQAKNIEKWIVCFINMRLDSKNKKTAQKERFFKQDESYFSTPAAWPAYFAFA